MARIRRRGENGLDAWPGYVDALSTLLMVIIFVLLVFVLSQAFLSVALSGRDGVRRELSFLQVRADASAVQGFIDLAAPAASNEATCTTAKVVASPSSLSSLLTRPGQLNNAQANREPVTATSCVGH